MKPLFQPIIALLALFLFTTSLYAQSTEKQPAASTLKTDFSDRQAIINATENFFIGDHTGSIKHKKLSMHEKGAYRYVNRDGAYVESIFNLDSNDSDTSYKEEILSVEIYVKLALVRLRLAENGGGAHYKLLTLHKANGEWKITSITWGSEITQ